jgi:hypothetical protein
VLEGVEHVADDEGARGCGDQRVHCDRLHGGARPLEGRIPTKYMLPDALAFAPLRE